MCAIRFAFRARGERLRIDVPTVAQQIPPGFVYIPKGRFLFGYGQDETLRLFTTAPMHRMTLSGYFIAQHETEVD
ncbi:MAG: hypothetical protein U0787_20150 [Polyangia bacterium]